MSKHLHHTYTAGVIFSSLRERYGVSTMCHTRKHHLEIFEQKIQIGNDIFTMYLTCQHGIRILSIVHFDDAEQAKRLLCVSSVEETEGVNAFSAEYFSEVYENVESEYKELVSEVHKILQDEGKVDLISLWPQKANNLRVA